MLDETGKFDFTGEVLDLAEQLWSSYQQVKGCPESRTEQLVALAYIVAALRQDVDLIWQEILAAPELQSLRLAELLAEELRPGDGAAAAAARAEMQRRGWLPEQGGGA